MTDPQSNECACGCRVPTRGGDYIRGHNMRAGRDERLVRHRQHWIDAGMEYGLCLCGCELPTPIAETTASPYHRLKGEPCRFIRGHVFHRPLEERFWEKVEKRGPDECWEWGGTVADGYGRFREGGFGSSPVRAHRVAYKLLVGPIPEGLVLDHLCENRGCVNPAHLEPVTNRENLRRHYEGRS